MATGGAIESTGGGMVVNCTFSDNVVLGGSGGAGGQGTGVGRNGNRGDAGTATGGAIYGRGSEVAVANSILANSKITVAGNVSDRGGNLSTDLNPLLTSGFTLRLTNPGFLPLANNGGPTPTMALQTNSLAINRGLGEFCPPVDQRGTNRAGICDIGAFELFTANTNIPLPQIPGNVLSSFAFTRSTNELVLQWPTGYTNLYLQVTTNLAGSNTAWSTLASRTTNNGLNTFSVNTAVGTRPKAFFRLFGLTNLALTNLLGTNVSDTNIVFPPFP
jgi:hypothetical protein